MAAAVPLSDHAVSVMGDHAEAVGDGFGDGLPFPWQGPVEEVEDRLGEPAQVGMEPVTPHVAVHDPAGRVGPERSWTAFADPCASVVGPSSRQPPAPDRPQGLPGRGPPCGTRGAGRAPCRGRDGGSGRPGRRRSRHRAPRARPHGAPRHLHPAPAHDPRQRSALIRRQDVSGHATACVLFRPPVSGTDGPFRGSCQPLRAN